MAVNLTNNTILVVDDDEPLRRISLICLCQAGYSVLTAANAPQALTHLAAANIDLVLLDIDLCAELDGIDILKHIRDTPATAQLPVMILSGQTAFSEIRRGAAAGADHYMAKPYLVADVLSNVRRILEPHEAL